MRRGLYSGMNILAPKPNIQTILERVNDACFFTMPLPVVDLTVFGADEEVVKTAGRERHARDRHLGL
jgi:hypothetical protein